MYISRNMIHISQCCYVTYILYENKITYPMLYFTWQGMIEYYLEDSNPIIFII